MAECCLGKDERSILSRPGSMPSPKFQYKDLRNVLRRLLQDQDEPYFHEYIPPARDAIIIMPKYMLYVLIGAVMIIVGTYVITSHLIKDLFHDLADWLLGPDLNENEEEKEEVVETSGQEVRTGASSGIQKDHHRSTSRDENNPGFNLPSVT